MCHSDVSTSAAQGFCALEQLTDTCLRGCNWPLCCMLGSSKGKGRTRGGWKDSSSLNIPASFISISIKWHFSEFCPCPWSRALIIFIFWVVPCLHFELKTEGRDSGALPRGYGSFLLRLFWEKLGLFLPGRKWSELNPYSFNPRSSLGSHFPSL